MSRLILPLLTAVLCTSACGDISGMEDQPCSKRGFCRSGLMCVDFVCRPQAEGTVGGVGLPCNTNDACADGLWCQEGMCTRSCTSFVDCPDSALVCIEAKQACAVPCSNSCRYGVCSSSSGGGGCVPQAWLGTSMAGLGGVD